jgi:tRNA-uridine 2-sulfurtransferase
MNKPNNRVAVGMSGGVDSSLAAALLKMDGYDVVGITMKIFDGADISAECKGHACYGPGEADDIRQAGEVADFLGIPHYVIELEEEYRTHVLSYFTSEYLAGKTPNPCTRCNPVMKFGFLLDRAKSAGISFDRFATGHYVQTCWMDTYGRHVITKAADIEKDQSYFLYGLPKEMIPALLFPLGAITKETVRAKAAQLKLPVADRPESQDFIEGGDYAGLFSGDDVRPGDIIDIHGHKMGIHTGIVNYTVGQRKGLGIPYSEPLYVLRINARDNTIVVAPKSYLYAKSLTAGQVNLIAVDQIDSPMRIVAKIRQQHQGAAALLTPLDNRKVRVIFESPQLAITPGQSVVFYDNDVVLGGGIIETSDTNDSVKK